MFLPAEEGVLVLGLLYGVIDLILAGWIGTAVHSASLRTRVDLLLLEGSWWKFWSARWDRGYFWSKCRPARGLSLEIGREIHSLDCSSNKIIITIIRLISWGKMQHQKIAMGLRETFPMREES